jgi:hypothetical protein
MIRTRVVKIDSVEPTADIAYTPLPVNRRVGPFIGNRSEKRPLNIYGVTEILVDSLAERHSEVLLITIVRFAVPQSCCLGGPGPRYTRGTSSDGKNLYTAWIVFITLRQDVVQRFHIRCIAWSVGLYQGLHKMRGVMLLYHRTA